MRKRKRPNEIGTNMFKDSFKYYKSRNPPPDLKNVIDVSTASENIVKKISARFTDEDSNGILGLEPAGEWGVFEFQNIPGLIFIQNPFTPEGQRFWITKCLKEYSAEPNKLNLDIETSFDRSKSWWDQCFENPTKNDLASKLRWATLGYHHNWDSKFYSEDSKSPMPKDLQNLSNFLARTTGFLNFRAEAAIINYYRMNSTLAGHTDQSEVNVEAPLFSISFGQSAIFLIGGLSKEDPAEAIFLRSGDVIVMSGESRLRYHGVPKILPSDEEPWTSREFDSSENLGDWSKAKLYVKEARINMNVRQVLNKGQLTL